MSNKRKIENWKEVVEKILSAYAYYSTCVYSTSWLLSNLSCFQKVFTEEKKKPIQTILGLPLFTNVAGLYRLSVFWLECWGGGMPTIHFCAFSFIVIVYFLVVMFWCVRHRTQCWVSCIKLLDYFLIKHDLTHSRTLYFWLQVCID